MSIDYSDMAFPKPARKKKKKMHKKSILRTKKGICFLCELLYDDCSEQYTEEHHIMYGSGQRELSEGDGLKVYLCMAHHKDGPEAVHNNRTTREILCRLAQKEYEQNGKQGIRKIIYKVTSAERRGYKVCHDTKPVNHGFLPA